MIWHTIYQWLILFFSWPTGSVWSNILAEPILIVLGYIGLSKLVTRIESKLEAHHQQKLTQAREHHEIEMDKLNEIHEHIKSAIPPTGA